MSTAGAVELDALALGSGLLGGLALFLFGMDVLTRAMRQLAGDALRAWLARMTANRFVGLVAGAVLTALVQSSSITTVLLVGFVSAGLMSTAQTVAIILGANIGTTITAQILAFKPTALALPMLAAGYFAALVARRGRPAEWGRVFLGLGMLFLGMNVMSEAVAPLRDYPPFLEAMTRLDSPLPALLLGAGFTALVQSSSATTGILIVMAGEGLLALEPAIAMILGANVGTCVTALLAAIGKPRAAVRTALIHTLFNLAGALLWLGFIPELAAAARWMSPVHPELTGAARAAAEVPRQLANVHTLFNLANAAIFIWFTPQLARLVERLLPDRPEQSVPGAEPRHLDPQLLGVPPIALDAVRREIARLAGMVRALFAECLNVVISGSPDDLERLHVMDRPVDLLHRAILDYLRRLGQRDLTPEQGAAQLSLARIANDLEHIGDLISVGMVRTGQKRIEEEVVISQATAELIGGLHGRILAAFDEVIAALEGQDIDRAEAARRMCSDIGALVDEIARHEELRLRADAPRRLTTYAREIEITEALDDIFRILQRIALTELALFRGQAPARTRPEDEEEEAPATAPPAG
jgi:phosphate:Na+ symporter